MFQVIWAPLICLWRERLTTLTYTVSLSSLTCLGCKLSKNLFTLKTIALNSGGCISCTIFNNKNYSKFAWLAICFIILYPVKLSLAPPIWHIKLPFFQMRKYAFFVTWNVVSVGCSALPVVRVFSWLRAECTAQTAVKERQLSSIRWWLDSESRGRVRWALRVVSQLPFHRAGQRSYLSPFNACNPSRDHLSCPLVYQVLNQLIRPFEAFSPILSP